MRSWNLHHGEPRIFLKVGSRNSKLSLVQTDLVVSRILQKNAGLRIDRKIIETAVDASRGRSMFSLEQRGIVDKDVDQQILEGRVDFAVHNMKDVPIIDRSARLVIASIPERGSPAEALVSVGDLRLKDLVRGSKVGTSNPVIGAPPRTARPGLIAGASLGEG